MTWSQVSTRFSKEKRVLEAKRRRDSTVLLYQSLILREKGRTIWKERLKERAKKHWVWVWDSECLTYCRNGVLTLVCLSRISIAHIWLLLLWYRIIRNCWLRKKKMVKAMATYALILSYASYLHLNSLSLLNLDYFILILFPKLSKAAIASWSLQVGQS